MSAFLELHGELLDPRRRSRGVFSLALLVGCYPIPNGPKSAFMRKLSTLRTHRRVLLLVLVGIAVSFGSVALGAAAFAANDDRAETEAMLRAVESSPRKDVAAEFLSRSRAALARGAQLRSAGDESHARIADGVARTWAEASRDLLKAVAIEQQAHTARSAASDAGTVAERERALLEEGIAQSGRLRAQLEQVERDTKSTPAKTSTAATGDTGGKAAPPRGAASGSANPKRAGEPTPSDRRDGGAR